MEDTGAILVIRDSVSIPALNPSQKRRMNNFKDMATYVIHPGGDSRNSFIMFADLPPGLARYPLAQTPDRSKQSIGVFALKLRECFKTYLNGSEHWQPSYYTGLMVDTFFDDLILSEILELQTWY